MTGSSNLGAQVPPSFFNKLLRFNQSGAPTAHRRLEGCFVRKGVCGGDIDVHVNVCGRGMNVRVSVWRECKCECVWRDMNVSVSVCGRT